MVLSNSVWEAFATQARRQPQALAVLDNEECVSYGELARLASSLASTLPKDARFVGVVMDHSTAHIASLLAVLKAGAAYVPAEPDFPIERLRFMMDEPSVDVVLTQHTYAERLKGLPLQWVEGSPAVLDSPEGAQRVARSPREPTAAQTHRQDTVSHQASSSTSASQPSPLAYVLYTSGSTGTPKGVCVTNANVCSYAKAFAEEFVIGPGDVMLQQSVCSFDIFVEEVFGSLLNGAAIAIPPAGPKSGPLELLEYAERAGVTIVSAFPYLLADWNYPDSLPSTMRLLISGGDVLRASYVQHLLPQVPVYNTYGPSETTVCATYCRVNDTSALQDGAYPIGVPRDGVGIALFTEAGEPARPGEIGEICISGNGVSAGYMDASKNAAFRPLPDGTPAFYSGDLGRWLPNGELAFCGRKDAQVMIGGKRVEPEEVESVLCLSPEVAAALVVAREDEQGLPYLTAYLVPADPESAQGHLPAGAKQAFPLSHVITQAKRHLTPFMIPEYFVLVDEIPLTANGKPNASALPAVLKPLGGQA